MTPHFKTAVVIGVGLLGGSLGLALKKRGIADTVRGVGRRKTSLDTALEHGAIDEAFLEIAPAAQDADLIVICTPSALVTSKLNELLPVCKESAILTDVASTKGNICGQADDTWPQPRRFIGSHPMAGSEKYGPENATEDFYEQSVTFVEKSDSVDPEAREAIVNLWTTLGSRVVDVDPATHDELVSLTSHIPHVVASALAGLVEGKAEAVRPFIGNGFLDVTRVAGSRPSTWRDVCLTNCDAIVKGLGIITEELRQIQEAITVGDGNKLEEFFSKGRDARREALDE